MEHTPLPWYAEMPYKSDIKTHNPIRKNQPLIAMMHNCEEKYANAEFIVKACNSYDAMLEALQAARRLSLLPYAEREDGIEWNEDWEKVEAAIAKTEEV